MGYAKTNTILIIILILLPISDLYTQGVKFTKVNQINTFDIKYSRFNINKISTLIYNNGNADVTPDGNSGFFYPNGSGASAIYASGFIWGGLIDGEVKVGGSTYRSGLQPGKILNTGLAENPDDPSVRVYRVRPDYKSAYFYSEIKDGEGTQKEIRARYEKDWNEWPAAKGAPYTDNDRNGIYNPSIDIPGVQGAAQTLWFVANDLDSTLTKNLYGSLPIGIELQVTIWGDTSSQLENMIFKKYKLINKSGKTINDMYIGVWSDPDVGYSDDDLVGCDTLLNLGFAYNAYLQDQYYSASGNLSPPAVGFTLLEGPVVNGSPSDSARSGDKICFGLKNLPMTAFAYFASVGGFDDPPQSSYDYTIQYYNFMQGRFGTSGEQFTDLVSGKKTTFALSGDPVTRHGWIDGMQLPPGDRRMMSSSGPFTLANSDTQEVVFAEIAAGAENNIGNLEAITYLRNYSAFANELFKNNFKKPESPPSPNVKATGLDRMFVLTWGNNVNQSNSIEHSKSGNYFFQGYNVYQFSSADYQTAKSIKVATFDLVDSVSIIYDYVWDTVNKSRIYTAVQKGLNTGLQRYFIFDKDYFTGLPLNNGKKYYFAVTSYSYNSAFHISPPSLEDEPNILTVIPQSPLPGVKYGANVNDILNLTHTAGSGKGIVQPVIIDPTQLTGHRYKITFSSSGNGLHWNLTDATTNTLILSDQLFSFSDDSYTIDGFILKTIDNSIEPFTSADVFTFTTPGSTFDENQEKVDVEKVNVFPNPYYGFNSNEETNYIKFVTFSHLPQKATIRIFDLAGRLVKTLKKDSPDQFYRFYLFTDTNTPLGSGIYVAFIEMPELGKTKILKFAIITPQAVPEHF